MLGRPCFSCGSFELWAQTALRRRRTLGAVGAAGWAGTGAGRYWLQHSMQRVGLRAQRAARWAESTPELLPPVQLAQPALSQILVAMAQGFGRVLVAQGARGTALLGFGCASRLCQLVQRCLDSAGTARSAGTAGTALLGLGEQAWLALHCLGGPRLGCASTAKLHR